MFSFHDSLLWFISCFCILLFRGIQRMLWKFRGMARHFQLIYRQTIGKLKKYLETLYHILVIIGEKTGGTVRRIGKTEETDDK